MAWEARRLMRSLKVRFSRGHPSDRSELTRPWRQGTGATHPLTGGTMGEWASAGDPSHEYIVQGTARAKARVRVHSGQDATRRTRRERRENQWERSSTNLSEEELRKRGAKQVRCARLFLFLLLWYS